MNFIQSAAIFSILLYVMAAAPILKAQPKAGDFSATAGVTLRTNADTYFRSAETRQIHWAPFDYDQNLIGKRISLGIEYHVTERLAFEYFTNLGYDLIYSYPDPDSRFYFTSQNGDTLAGGYMNRIEVKEFLFDHNIQLARKGKINYGMGLSIINAGKGLEYEVNGHTKYHNIQFISYNAFVQIPILKVINTELKLQYLNSGLPTPPNDMIISLRVFYRLDLFNNRKEV